MLPLIFSLLYFQCQQMNIMIHVDIDILIVIFPMSTNEYYNPCWHWYSHCYISNVNKWILWSMLTLIFSLLYFPCQQMNIIIHVDIDILIVIFPMSTNEYYDPCWHSYSHCYISNVNKWILWSMLTLIFSLLYFQCQQMNIMIRVDIDILIVIFPMSTNEYYDPCWHWYSHCYISNVNKWILWSMLTLIFSLLYFPCQQMNIIIHVDIDILIVIFPMSTNEYYDLCWHWYSHCYISHVNKWIL